jgi:hypothetical protein
MGRRLQVIFLAAMCPVPAIGEWGEVPTKCQAVRGTISGYFSPGAPRGASIEPV